jgi:DNA modification methylase
MNVVSQESGKSWTLYEADCVDVLGQLPNASVDFCLHSPPFSSLYHYTPTERDLGNCRDDAEFFQHYAFVTRELLRVIRPGRHVAVHCQQLVTYESKEGVAGLKDFRGDIIRHFTGQGFVYHSEVCIWKSPQAQAIRNHPRGLLFVQLDRDAAWMRQGLADYILVFRTPGDNAVPVHTDLTRAEWIEWAAPIWTDIRETDVLPFAGSKDNDDERHLCPLQLSVCERCIRLWTNKGEVVLDPFTGIGSVGVEALRQGRRFIGAELKASYARVAARFLREAETVQQRDLFSLAEPS